MATKRKTRARKQPRQERSQTSVDAILAATDRILNNDGLAKLTTSRIAEAAGVSVGSLYQYFPSKEAIIGELLERRLIATVQLFSTVLETTLEVPIATAAGITVRGMIAHQRSVGSRLEAPFLEAYATTNRRTEYRAYMKQVTAILATYLERRAADIRVTDFQGAAFTLIACAEGIAQGLAYDEWNEAEWERAAVQATDLVQRYLLA